jgi:RHS repeat-associated protein
LIQVTYPGGVTDTYTYDAVGNRQTKVSGGVTTSYTYDGADQMTQTTVGSTNTMYTYDANGNQVGRASDVFKYDHENRQTSSTIAGATSSSGYNGDGLRVSHTPAGQTAANYIWDVAASLPVVLTDGTNTYVYGLDLISSTVNSTGAQTYYLYDGLGSTMNLTSAPSGNSTQGYAYDVFGATPGGPPPGSNQWLFTGEQRDNDSGMYYLRARYYDPVIGRFLTRDPLPGGHPYMYSGNNPVNRVDPSGMFFQQVMGGVVGGAGGFLATYAGDWFGDCDNLLCATDLETWVPDSSWKEYLGNTLQGAFVGATCATAGPACYGIRTGTTSLFKQYVVSGGATPDLCQAVFEGAGAYVGATAGLWLFPNKGGRYPQSIFSSSWWTKAQAQKQYGRGFLASSFGLNAYTFEQGLCGPEQAYADAPIGQGKE